MGNDEKKDSKSPKASKWKDLFSFGSTTVEYVKTGKIPEPRKPDPQEFNWIIVVVMLGLAPLWPKYGKFIKSVALPVMPKVMGSLGWILLGILGVVLPFMAVMAFEIYNEKIKKREVLRGVSDEAKTICLLIFYCLIAGFGFWGLVKWAVSLNHGDSWSGWLMLPIWCGFMGSCFLSLAWMATNWVISDPSYKLRKSGPVSYKLELVIQPHWIEILKDIYPDLKKVDTSWFDLEKPEKDKASGSNEGDIKLPDVGSEEQEQAVRDFLKSKGIDTPKGEEFLNKTFRFVVFHDDITGMERIWSDHHKTFVDEMMVEGYLLKSLVIWPEVIGFKYPWDEYPTSRGGVEDKSEIPFYELVEFFVDLCRNGRDGSWLREDFMRGIEKFPDQIQKDLDRRGVQYEMQRRDWWHDDEESKKKEWKEEIDAMRGKTIISSRELRWHVFRAKYYSLGMNMKTFEIPKAIRHLAVVD